jgi:hypothetical protein
MMLSFVGVLAVVLLIIEDASSQQLTLLPEQHTALMTVFDQIGELQLQKKKKKKTERRFRLC